MAVNSTYRSELSGIDLRRYTGVVSICCSSDTLFNGAALVRWPNKILSEDTRLTAPGLWAGFIAGLAAVIANPKASLFYMTLLPSFFDFNLLTRLDMVAICMVSFCVPLVGNLTLTVFVDRMRRFLASPDAVRKTNIGAGIALIFVGLVIVVI